jgi:hypothetical protein
VPHLRPEPECVLVQTAEQTTVKIPLTGGMFALVDAADYELVSSCKWEAHRSGSAIYARQLGPSGTKRIRMHRLILGAPDGIQVDHASGDTLDNRRANLRLASNQENARNRKTTSRNIVGLKGVERRPNGSYRATLHTGERRLRFGPFATAEEAALAYDSAAREHFGCFALCNYPLTDIQPLAAE